MMLTPDGKLIHSALTAEEVKKHLEGAKWRIDAAEVPDQLKKGWRAFEFGQIQQAATVVKQAVASSDAKIKAAAKKIDDMMKADVATRFKDAQTKALVADQKWEAYKLFDGVVQNYKVYPEASKASSEMGKLRSDAKVKRELQAKVMLDKIQEWQASPRKTEKDLVKPGIQQLEAQFGDTEAAQTAKSIKTS